MKDGLLALIGFMGVSFRRIPHFPAGFAIAFSLIGFALHEAS